MSSEDLTPQAILRDCPRMGLDDRFTFECGAGRDCFTQCCANVSIVLAPYDILRIKRALGMDSSECLRQYTITPFTKDQKFPAVLLKMDPASGKCPFVTAEGCSIYADRPWACRMYPLGVAEPRNPSPKDRTFHFLVREDLCQGHGQKATWTVREWISGQGVEAYDMQGASFKELMLHDFWDKDQELPPEKIEMYFMACYDLDRFRRFVFDTRFLRLFEVDESRIEAMRKDDEELLDFAMQWLRFSLFQEQTMKIKPSVVKAGRRAAASTGRVGR